jgi:hypothetical protein
VVIRFYKEQSVPVFELFQNPRTAGSGLWKIRIRKPPFPVISKSVKN